MQFIGHFLAFASVFLWSSLYVCVKILLEVFTPLELLFLQFIIGYCFLLLICPRFLKSTPKEELYFILAGLSGITIYNLFLNLAMDYSKASNVSVIIATAPLFTALLATFLKIEKLSSVFFIAFTLCMGGIVLLSYEEGGFSLNPLGDGFALLSALGWATYSLLILKIMQKTNHLLLVTRRIIFYGILGMLPSFLFLEFSPNLELLLELNTALNLLFLSLFASGLCFVLWNHATLLIGAVKTNVYVYLTPIITIITAFFVLGEKLSILALFGAFLTLFGVILAESKFSKKP
ncbi:DMT family transporter [Helicobacter turcicus]|uniref:DMT family transporter n=1 Tax=Helicobacter turcicus TaxID=2867412 RepID=A0ABS7JMS7_9HELI|nr:DMT family transporter [Helicobacter turcicus]MBX7490686.1 DMT family transporter [Helicobacter turcicus]MBX7545406.1 DMT family transporter [Helicobacter turcicus]